MELPVARQAVEFAWAAALGLALGCWYDVLLSLIHISEPTRQAEISYAVFCLKKEKAPSMKEY